MCIRDRDWGGSAGFGGENGLGLGDGTSALQDLAELDALAEQLGQDYGGARPDDLSLIHIFAMRASVPPRRNCAPRLA